MKIVLLLSLLVSLSSQASNYKEFSESSGTKDNALEKLGKPSIKKEFTAPNFQVKGIGPISCKKANELQAIEVWSYKEADGFYQLIFNKNKLVCLRWSSSAEPFSNIQP